MGIPRLRMFAGPNGSGKSTIKDVIATQMKGGYRKASGILYFENYSVYLSQTEFEHYFYQSPLTFKASNHNSPLKPL